MQFYFLYIAEQWATVRHCSRFEGKPEENPGNQAYERKMAAVNLCAKNIQNK